MSLQTKTTQLLFLFAKRAFRHLLSDAVPTQFSEFSINSVKIFSPTLRLIYMGERRPPAKPGPPSRRAAHKIWDPLRTPPAWRQPESRARTDAHPRMGPTQWVWGLCPLSERHGGTDERVADPICAGRGASLKCDVSPLRLGQPLRQRDQWWAFICCKVKRLSDSLPS